MSQSVKMIHGLNQGLSWLSKLSFITHTTSQTQSSFFRLLAGQNQSQIGTTTDESKNDQSTEILQDEQVMKTRSVGSVTSIPPPKDLVRLCRQCEWGIFIEECTKDPEKLFWVGSHGQNLLHFVCTRRPNLKVVNEFTSINHDAVMKEDHDGCLPLHMAMTNGASHEVLCCLIQQAPGTIFHSNKWDYYPFDWIWRRCKYELKHIDNDDKEEENLVWRTIQELVRAASLQRGGTQSGTILHLAMDFDCPIDLIKCIIEKFPEMTMEKDSDGRTCLARAVSSHHLPSSELIRLLLQVDKSCATEEDRRGQIPIHLAILNQVSWNEGVRTLFYAAPISIQVKDPVTNLYPFQLMATKLNEEESQLSLCDLFEVLSLCPTVVQHTKS